MHLHMRGHSLEPRIRSPLYDRWSRRSRYRESGISHQKPAKAVNQPNQAAPAYFPMQAIRNRAKPAHLRTSEFFSGWFGNNQKPENPDHEQGKL